MPGPQPWPETSPVLVWVSQAGRDRSLVAAHVIFTLCMTQTWLQKGYKIEVEDREQLVGRKRFLNVSSRKP